MKQLLLLLLTLISATAVPIKFTWDAADPADFVAGTNLYQRTQTIALGITTTTYRLLNPVPIVGVTGTVDISGPMDVIARFVNTEGFESVEDSNMVHVPAPPKPLNNLHRTANILVEESPDLLVWNTRAIVPIDAEQPRSFYRMTLSQ